MRRLVLLVVGVVGLLAAEGLLRWTGCGYSPEFCRRLNGTNFVENDKFLWQFYSRNTSLRPTPFVAAVEKPADSLRVVVLGESAAAGTPDPAYSFGRILERMLASELPQKRVEVLCAAMPGVNSHVLLPIARDCLQLKPDLLLIYAGNDEAMGLYAPGPDSGWLASHRTWLRTLQKMRRTRVAQCLDRVWDSSPGGGVPPNQDDQFFATRRVSTDDPRRAAVYANFHSNLLDICTLAQQGGARVLLSTVAVNLKDFPPLSSLHRPNLAAGDLARWQAEYSAGVKAAEARQPAVALTHLTAAAGVDDHFADLHFHLARCYLALEQPNKARDEFALARDWDALAWRADSRLNDIVRRTATALPPGVGRLVDGERALAEAEVQGVGVPGENLFYDHTHLNFDGNYLLAKALLPAVRALLGVGGATNAPALSREECATRLAFTRINEWQAVGNILKTTALPPFTAQLEHSMRQAAAEKRLTERFGNPIPGEVPAATQEFQAALRQYPQDWLLAFNYGQMLLMSRKYAPAVEAFETARRGVPHWMPVRVGLSVALSGAGKYAEAMQALQEALKYDPSSTAVRAGIAALEARWRGGSAPSLPVEPSPE